MGIALSRERQARLFDRLEWLDRLHSMALLDRRPLLLRAQWQDAESWLPLMQTKGRWFERRRFEGLANYYNFTFAPIFSRAHGEAAKLTLLQALAQTAKGVADRIDFYEVPDEDKSASLLQAAFERMGWLCTMEQHDVNHILNVQGRSFTDYWLTRPSQLRNTVKRKAQKGVVSIRIERRFLPDMWADYERVYAQSWKPEEGSAEFLRDRAYREGAAGCLRLGVAYIDGAPVAAQFWTCENGVALIHKLAHTKDSMPHSPGSLLSFEMFREAIDIDRVHIIDFGTGDDGYKSDWMDTIRPRYYLRMVRPQAPANWPVMAKQAVNRLAARRRGD